MTKEYIDPDPVSVAGLAISLVGTIIGTVSLYLQLRPRPPEASPGHEPIQEMQLDKLASHVEQLRTEMRRLVNNIEANSPDADGEFFDAPVRLGRSHLLLSKNGLQSFQENYSQASLQVSAIGSWLTNIQINNPSLSYRLGQRMDPAVPGIAEQVNKILEEGRNMRELLAELRSALTELETAVKAEHRGGNSGSSAF